MEWGYFLVGNYAIESKSFILIISYDDVNNPWLLPIDFIKYKAYDLIREHR